MEGNDFKLDSTLDLPLREVVFLKLREAILTGVLSPGDRLMEIKLADKMGVSRTPVREAIRKLELEGLATMIPRRGAIVSSITKKEMKDVLEVRTTLEDLAVTLACERISHEQLNGLREANNSFKAAVEQGDIIAIVEADIKFHHIIYKSTDNDKLMQILSNLREQLYRYRLEYIKNRQIHPILIKEHCELIKYLREGDAQRAKATIEKHIINQERDIEKHIAKEAYN